MSEGSHGAVSLPETLQTTQMVKQQRRSQTKGSEPPRESRGGAAHLAQPRWEWHSGPIPDQAFSRSSVCNMAWQHNQQAGGMAREAYPRNTSTRRQAQCCCTAFAPNVDSLPCQLPAPNQRTACTLLSSRGSSR